MPNKTRRVLIQHDTLDDTFQKMLSDEKENIDNKSEWGKLQNEVNALKHRVHGLEILVGVYKYDFLIDRPVSSISEPIPLDDVDLDCGNRKIKIPE